MVFVAKFSKRLNKEPKEDFTILAGLHKIVPDIRNKGECEITYGQLGQLLKEINPGDAQPSKLSNSDVNMVDEEEKDQNLA